MFMLLPFVIFISKLLIKRNHAYSSKIDETRVEGIATQAKFLRLAFLYLNPNSFSLLSVLSKTATSIYTYLFFIFPGVHFLFARYIASIVLPSTSMFFFMYFPFRFK